MDNNRELLIRFHPIKDHPNYGVNALGNICNYKKKTILKPIEDDRGYLRVRLDGKRELVSRIVAENYIPNPYNKPNVTYKDGNRNNVRFDNLKWASNSDIKRLKRHKIT